MLFFIWLVGRQFRRTRGRYIRGGTFRWLIHRSTNGIVGWFQRGWIDRRVGAANEEMEGVTDAMADGSNDETSDGLLDAVTDGSEDAASEGFDESIADGNAEGGLEATMTGPLEGGME